MLKGKTKSFETNCLRSNPFRLISFTPGFNFNFKTEKFTKLVKSNFKYLKLVNIFFANIFDTNIQGFQGNYRNANLYTIINIKFLIISVLIILAISSYTMF